VRVHVIRPAVTRTPTGWINIARLTAARAITVQAAGGWTTIPRAAARRTVIPRAAARRTVILRAAVVWAAVVWATTIVWPAVGGRDQGQRPEQQADEDLGAQQVHPPARTGGLHGLRHGTDPRPGGGRLRRGQAPPRQRGGAIVIPEQRDPRPPLRILAAPLRGRRVGREDGPLQRCPQLPGGLMLRPGQHPALDRVGKLRVQRAGVLVDQPCPVEVDRALTQGRQGRGEPAGQAHRQAHPVLGAALGQRQGQRNLARGEPGLQLGNGVVATPAGVRDRAAVPSIRGPVAVLSTGVHRARDTAAPATAASSWA
jgi:hypothetical protein